MTKSDNTFTDYFLASGLLTTGVAFVIVLSTFIIGYTGYAPVILGVSVGLGVSLMGALAGLEERNQQINDLRKRLRKQRKNVGVVDVDAISKADGEVELRAAGGNQ